VPDDVPNSHVTDTVLINKFSTRIQCALPVEILTDDRLDNKANHYSIIMHYNSVNLFHRFFIR